MEVLTEAVLRLPEPDRDVILAAVRKAKQDEELKDQEESSARLAQFVKAVRKTGLQKCFNPSKVSRTVMVTTSLDWELNTNMKDATLNDVNVNASFIDSELVNKWFARERAAFQKKAFEAIREIRRLAHEHGVEHLDYVEEVSFVWER